MIYQFDVTGSQGFILKANPYSGIQESQCAFYALSIIPKKTHYKFRQGVFMSDTGHTGETLGYFQFGANRQFTHPE